MTHPRLIPVLLLKHGLLVRSQSFRLHQAIGNPMSTVQRLSNWNVDEVVLLDISSGDRHDLRRDDLQQAYGGASALDVLKEIARVCLVPLAFGGRIRSLGDMEARLNAGADKCIVNTQALAEPDFVAQAARRFGSQCVVVSIDAARTKDGRWTVFSQSGRVPVDQAPDEWARQVEKLGAGEIFLNSIDRDGTAQGYDLDLIRLVSAAVRIPVVACGGVGDYGDFGRAILVAGASAAAAANIFHFCELSYPAARRTGRKNGVEFRDAACSSRWSPREPVYPEEEKKRRMTRAASRVDPARYDGSLRREIRWCKKCLYPSMSATPLEFDENGVCTGCLMAEAKKAIPASDWKRRLGMLRELVDRCRSRTESNYDCVIPVSGGKDSYFQTHYLTRELGLRPLLVTYNGNNWTEEGWYNVHRMKEVFGVDHLFCSPSVRLLQKLNRLGVVVMGDMNWHAHVGIMSLPMRVAALHRIPLVFYGEHGYLDLGGQFSMNDFPEVSYRDRLEHFARGFEWNFFVGLEGITAQDMIPYRYPSDEEIFELDLRGLFLGNYIYWEANDHGPMVEKEYGFRTSPRPFDRTYRTMSNLDDMHENGAHDYLKFIKFGYGRCSDHVAKDIRAGRMTREEGIRRILQYDHIRPADLRRWFDYTGMPQSDFDRIADTFRDPRVWMIQNGEWTKLDVDGEERSYGQASI
jgi:imidazoleglycerol phosphate synthase cyclase subunit